MHSIFIAAALMFSPSLKVAALAYLANKRK